MVQIQTPASGGAQRNLIPFLVSFPAATTFLKSHQRHSRDSIRQLWRHLRLLPKTGLSGLWCLFGIVEQKTNNVLAHFSSPMGTLSPRVSCESKAAPERHWAAAVLRCRRGVLRWSVVPKKYCLFNGSSENRPINSGSDPDGAELLEPLYWCFCVNSGDGLRDQTWSPF